MQSSINREKQSIPGTCNLSAFRDLTIRLDVRAQNAPILRRQHDRPLHNLITLFFRIPCLFTGHHAKTETVSGRWKPDLQFEVRRLKGWTRRQTES